MKRILELLEKRKAMYAAIPYQVDTTTPTADQVATAIVDLYSKGI